MTKKGTLIWNILKKAQASCEHLTAEEIFLRARQEDAGIVMATVYNNLNALVAQGKVRRMRQSSGPDFFDGNVVAHAHLLCDCCGGITDVPLKDFEADLENRLETKINSYELGIHYICPACRGTEGM